MNKVLLYVYISFFVLSIAVSLCTGVEDKAIVSAVGASTLPEHDFSNQIPRGSHGRRAKGSNGKGQPKGGGPSEADQLIMNQKKQASNQHTILGWSLGVYAFLGFLALLAWYFDILSGFGRPVDSIMQDRQA